MRKESCPLIVTLMGACLAVAVAFAGCATSSPTTSASALRQTAAPSTPTATAHSWQQVTLPAQAALDGHDGLAVSPLDGSTAWFCAPTAGGSYEVWSTHDTGVTWQQISTLTPAGPAPKTSCSIVVAQSDPRTLAIMFSSGAGAAGDLQSVAYLSTDSGTHWSRIPGLVQISQLDRAGNNLFAVLMDTAVAPAAQQTQVVVSADGLQSWRALHPSSTLEHDSFFRFWLDRAQGWLIAATYNGNWWQTTDLGTTWTGLPSVPSASYPIQIDLGAWLPAQNQWDFCGWSAQPLVVECTTLLGTRWDAYVEMKNTVSCSTCEQNVPPPSADSCFPDALQADGSLLAVCPTANSLANTPTFGVYRLPFQGQAWQRVAMAPALLLSAPATGDVWYAGQTGVFTAALPA